MSKISYKEFVKHVSPSQQRYYIDVSRHPLMEHILHLQKYRREIKQLIWESENVKDYRKEATNLTLLSSIPKLPELTEFLNYKDQNTENCEIELSEEAVKSVLSKVVTRILLVVGYSVVSSNLLKMLSCLVYNYLKFLVFSMAHCTSLNKPFTVESLAKSLKEDGLTDIEGLYHYKEERVVKFQSRLYFECKRLHDILEENLKKPIPTSSKPLKRKRNDENLEKDTFYELSTDMTDDAIKEHFLGPEELVEEAYLNRKMKIKCETQVHD